MHEERAGEEERARRRFKQEAERLEEEVERLRQAAEEADTQAKVLGYEGE